MDRCRILFVSHSAVVSGAEAILLELVRLFAGSSAFVFEAGPLADRLAVLGLSVRVSKWAAGVSQVKRDSSVWRAFPVSGRLVAITAEIARAARGHDLIYANSQKAFILSAIAARLTRKPLIWHLHDIPDRRHFGKAQLRLQIALANACARAVIVPSVAVRDGFVGAGGAAHLVRIVPNGVDAPARDDRSRPAIRADLGLPEGLLIGVFSRLAEWKGQHVAIEAIAAVPDAHCIIAGTSLFGEDAYAASLTAQVARLGLEDRVTFLGHRSDVSELMRAVDIVVHPSTAPEPFGLTVVEAMLAETPVIGTATGAVPEILDCGRAGWLVPPGDVAALAEAVRSIIVLASDAALRVAHARQRAETHYSADRMVAEVTKVIQEVLARPRR